MMQNIKLLDCTFRDGGYYTNWVFPADVVQKYLRVMKTANIDYVEIGFRFLKQSSQFYGGHAYSTEGFLAGLDIPDEMRIAVMLNASDLSDPNLDPAELIQKRFLPAENSFVDLVRVASHLHEIDTAITACFELKKLGYDVGLNLMQITRGGEADIKKACLLAIEAGVDMLYFADSLGSLTPNDCSKIVKQFQKYWNGPLGFHAHDNMGMALTNCLTAIELGVSWIDSTITGMGRGAGNVATETILVALNQKTPSHHSLGLLMDLISEYFLPKKNQCHWGTNPYFYLAGKYGIHPTYIQQMLADSRFDKSDILAVMEQLKVNNPEKYSSFVLEGARNFLSGDPQSKWSPSNLMQDRDVLILGAGKSLVDHKAAIENYIIRDKPLVIALNDVEAIDEDLIDCRAACHPLRLMADISFHKKSNKLLITPYSMLSDQLRQEYSSKTVLDLGLKISGDGFDFSHDYAVTPSPLVLSYVVTAATMGKARSIGLAGFDGFQLDDPRMTELASLIEKYKLHQNSIEIKSLTPTRLPIQICSVYAL